MNIERRKGIVGHFPGRRHLQLISPRRLRNGVAVSVVVRVVPLCWVDGDVDGLGLQEIRRRPVPCRRRCRLLPKVNKRVKLSQLLTDLIYVVH